ncbi:hypothetical protein CEUSTIGMA_g6747.t1 [Chlamydomonas eustigma]|uniref:Mediator complex subunit 8 n=1 Tax=Chlamydomonas eustigma TaxID=1157962 RepID=A0A250X8C1_9CHLO|nr:hypothetical protein CEUSTIGMA_g6747.t1 [Chlamydomonas eustigma]|eukprot:GAX79306.1 hypothetical protein CEUSTIGMA_g6747.t1 [Chlamydomonas eustigma]
MAQDNQLLMGPGSNQLNLKAVRDHAVALRRSVDEAVQSLALDNPTLSQGPLHWESCLKKYSVINQQVMGLRDQMRGILKQVVVMPRFVDNPGVAHALPIQLASKLTPEMDAKDASTKAFVSSGPLGKGDVGTQYEQVSSQLDDYNRFVSSLTSSGGVLDIKGSLRSDIELGSRRIQSLITEAKEIHAAAALRYHPGGAAASAASASASIRGTAAGSAARHWELAKRARIDPAGSAGAQTVPGTKPLEPELVMLLTGDGLRAQQSIQRAH